LLDHSAKSKLLKSKLVDCTKSGMNSVEADLIAALIGVNDGSEEKEY